MAASNEIAPFNIPVLLETIDARGKSFTQGDEERRKSVLSAARELCFALETPIEAILRIAWCQPSLNACLRVAIELHFFERLTEDGGRPKSTETLAEMTGCDPELMGRIVKHLAAERVLNEVDANHYGSTPLADSLAIPRYRDGIPFWMFNSSFDCLLPSFAKLPEYLMKTGYKDPQSPTDGPFQYGLQTPLHFFEWLQANPKVFETFNNHMAGYRQGRPSWMNSDFYPVQDLLGKGFYTEDKDAVMLVDIGGGLGHDIEEFQSKHPELPGRLVLQDLPSVIKEAIPKLHKAIEPMEHDFFTPEPIKGARAYYMHSVLHDWPDNKCQEILKNVTSAMTPGYSKVLINENVIPNKDPHWMGTSLDIAMMSLMSSQERTEKNWRSLLDSVGLKVVKIWSHSPGTESLIEAELS
ncbi:hypothetical protein MMC11_000720 [Xylographa trunciseda]|nr:hypothetical protein [Xylographa trunciseda]